MASHLSFSLATLSSWRGHLFPCLDFRTPEWTKDQTSSCYSWICTSNIWQHKQSPKKNTKTCIVSFEVNNVYKPAQRNTPEKSNVLTCITVQFQVFIHLSTQNSLLKNRPKFHSKAQSCKPVVIHHPGGGYQPSDRMYPFMVGKTPMKF